MEKFSFEKFIVDTPPYKAIGLSIDDVLNISNTCEVRVDMFCKKCGEIKTFIYKQDYPRFHDVDGGRSYRGGMSMENANKHIQDDPISDLYYGMSFYCAKCNELHEYFFTTDRKRIVKVGQNPSFSDLQGNEIDKYKNLIPKYFIEFKSSLNCYAQGKGIAAFVYLRRILEHLVESKFEKLEIEKSGKEDFLSKIKEVQKVETIIPIELEEIKGHVYSILSKGVHEYEEQECMDLYDTVKFVITEILDGELIKKQREEKVKQVKAILINQSNKSSKID